MSWRRFILPCSKSCNNFAINCSMVATPPGKLALEIVARRKLEDARLVKNLGILAEFGRICESQTGRGDIEASGIGDIEALGSELQSMRLIMHAVQVETLRKAQIDAEKSVAADAI